MIITREAVERHRAGDRPEFYTAWWRDRIAALEASIVGVEIDPGFLTELPAIADCGLITNNYVAADHMRPLLPAYCDDWTPTSVTHLYGLYTAGVLDDGRQRTVLEWGGGFGNMARITRCYETPPTHIIVDSPIMLALQQAWLTELHSVEGVAFATHRDAELVTRVDSFVATWSLDECAPACTDWLISRDWFGASTVLVAMYPDKDLFPEAHGLHARLVAQGFREVPSFHPPSVYLVLTR